DGVLRVAGAVGHRLGTKYVPVLQAHLDGNALTTFLPVYLHLVGKRNQIRVVNQRIIEVVQLQSSVTQGAGDDPRQAELGVNAIMWIEPPLARFRHDVEGGASLDNQRIKIFERKLRQKLPDRIK